MRVPDTNSAIIVTGSLNMDFVVQVDRLPAPGETTLGSNFLTIPGGKGANQANAAGRLAAAGTVRMIGCTGEDAFATQLKDSLMASGVDVSCVRQVAGVSTGVALIWVERSGQNSIVVASGANNEVNPEMIAGLGEAYAGAACALFQLETPIDAVEAALSTARAAGAMTILDPAPARQLPASLLRLVDLMTPNETEACILLGRPPARLAPADAPSLAHEVLGLGPKAVVLKLGDAGCFYSDGRTEVFSAGFKVDAVDTTAAGDTFNAALAIALSEGRPIEDALRFANAAAAISVTRLGAQSSAPGRAEVEEFLLIR
ncbi:MAG: ribokinase [Bryobacteraceae bacterium]|nr:ribokinase [Bryobacteraceae bacterium]